MIFYPTGAFTLWKSAGNAIIIKFPPLALRHPSPRQ
jgi:hypothetical protein